MANAERRNINALRSTRHLQTSCESCDSDHVSTLASKPDIALIRNVLESLTRKSANEYVPGPRQRAFKCPHCNKAFASKDARYHIPRCEAKPKRARKTWLERVYGAIPMTTREIADLYNVREQLNDGPQGAD